MSDSISARDRFVCMNWPELWKAELERIIAERGQPKTEPELRRWIQEAQNRAKRELEEAELAGNTLRRKLRWG